MLKTIKLSKKYQKNIKDLKYESNKVREVIHNTFTKFENEHNYNVMEYSFDILLDDYSYIPSDTILSEGRYVRYIDMRKPLEMHLRLGGFIVEDNGYTVSIRGLSKNFKVSKKNSIFFSKITNNDRIRTAIDQYT